jgi:uncharacterized protein YegP (UPF0339 family)
MPGKYEVFQDIQGKYRFRLKAANYEIIAVSEAYDTKESCINGIHSVMKYAPNSMVKEV